MNARPSSSTAELESLERLWWEKFADVENRFCWVQTPAIQRILRGSYLREIVRITGRGGRILELGCGTGWLCILLAQLGASEVVGIDFSEAQINLAKRSADESGLASKITFSCCDGTNAVGVGGLFDAVIVHGFLHHLSASEIRSTLAGIPPLLKKDGVFVVFEPTRRAFLPVPPVNKWEQRLTKLRKLATRGVSYGVRRFSAEETALRELIKARDVGNFPHGPSPKEMPFELGELERYLSANFEVVAQKKCMAVSHQVLQDWLLREISHPFSTKLLLPIVALAASWMDRLLVSNDVIPNGVWTFDMFVCRRIGEGKGGSNGR